MKQKDEDIAMGKLLPAIPDPSMPLRPIAGGLPHSRSKGRSSSMDMNTNTGSKRPLTVPSSVPEGQAAGENGVESRWAG